MSRSIGGIAASLLLLGGCTGVPVLDIDSPLTVSEIIDRIQCESWNASRKHKTLKKWGGAADLYLQVDDSAGLTPTLTFIRPLAEAGTQFAFGTSAAVRRTRQRVYNEKVQFNIGTLNASYCNRAPGGYDLAGDLGIEDTLNIAMLSLDKDDQAAFAGKEAVGQTIQFIVTKNISGIGPTWTLTRFVGPGGLFGAERIDTHKLIVSFAPLTKGGVDKAKTNNRDLLFNSLQFQLR